MGLQVLSTVWGPKHIDLFFNAAYRSLTWNENKRALTGAKWNIFTDNVNEVRSRIDHTIPIEFNIQDTENLRAYIDKVQAASIWQMEEAINKNDRVLLAPPDTVFGDGTIGGLLAAGQDEHSVVVVPHPRVLPSLLLEINEAEGSFLREGEAKRLSNDLLLSLSWHHLHDSWVHAERGHPNQSSYVGGVEWWHIGHVIQGTHRLPSPYLIHFTPEDLMYFKSAISFGHFDHKWPGDILIHRGRQRYLGSSDSAFIVEVTEEDKNVPPILENQPKTGFWRNEVHNQHNAQILFTFRGV